MIQVYPDGRRFSKEFLKLEAWEIPIKVLKSDGLGMQLPHSDMDLSEFVDILGKFSKNDIYL